MIGIYPAFNGLAPNIDKVLVPLKSLAYCLYNQVKRRNLPSNQFCPSNQNGFTLIETISVIIILGVMVSVGIKKIDWISGSSSITLLNAGIRELNTRETLEWSKVKMSNSGYTNDVEVYEAVDKNLGPDYRWDPPPDINTGKLHHDSKSVTLNRTASTANSVGYWK